VNLVVSNSKRETILLRNFLKSAIKDKLIELEKSTYRQNVYFWGIRGYDLSAFEIERFDINIIIYFLWNLIFMFRLRKYFKLNWWILKLMVRIIRNQQLQKLFLLNFVHFIFAIFFFFLLFYCNTEPNQITTIRQILNLLYIYCRLNIPFLLMIEIFPKFYHFCCIYQKWLLVLNRLWTNSVSFWNYLWVKWSKLLISNHFKLIILK